MVIVSYPWIVETEEKKMKKKYFKSLEKLNYSDMVNYNMKEHKLELARTSLDNEDIKDIRDNLLSDEHVELHEKDLFIKSDTDLTVIKKLYDNKENEYIYLVTINKNKLTINNGVTEYYKKVVKR